MDKRLIIIPAFNEEKNIKQVIENIRKYCDTPILVIDDGSEDKTLSLLKKVGVDYIIQHKKNFGYGKSLIDGFNFAINSNFDFVVTIDADNQHDASYILQFFKEIKKFDIISGTRYHPNSPVRTPIGENSKRINYEIVNFLNSTLNISITDAFCGFKAYRVEKLSKMDLTIDDYALPLQILVQAVRKNFRFRESPIPSIFYNPRKNYDKILGSIDETIDYFKKVIIIEQQKFKITSEIKMRE